MATALETWGNVLPVSFAVEYYPTPQGSSEEPWSSNNVVARWEEFFINLSSCVGVWWSDHGSKAIGVLSIFHQLTVKFFVDTSVITGISYALIASW